MKKIKTEIMTLFGKGRKFALKQYTLFLQNVEIAVGHGPKGPKCPTHISLLKLFLPDRETNMRQFVCKAKLCRLVATQTVRVAKAGNEPSAKFSKSVGTFSGLKAPTSTFTFKNQEKALVVCRGLLRDCENFASLRLQLYKTPTFGWQADVADLGEDGLPGVRRQGRGLRSRYRIDIV